MSDIINEIANVTPKTKEQVTEAVSNAVMGAKELAQEVHAQKEGLQSESSLEQSIVDKNGYDQESHDVNVQAEMSQDSMQAPEVQEVTAECGPDF